MPATSGRFPLARALRIHQWLKNLLVFVPLVAAHEVLSGEAFLASLLAFFAFSFTASALYLVNDLADRDADRRHPTKRNRPIAAGELTPRAAIAWSAILLLAGFALAVALAGAFLGVLTLYAVSSLAYSALLKHREILDVLVLAGLYTLRILGGGAATGIPLSFWLLTFSIFLFFGLAVLKRHAELQSSLAEGEEGAWGRGYRVDDVPLLLALGPASGFLAVLVLALYLNSAEVTVLYAQPGLLWLLCPLLLFWISRCWFVSHRGKMHEDPVVFAATDRASLAVAAAGLVVLWVAA